MSVDQFALWTGLFGGLALFLFGMNEMTAALKRAAGDSMRDLLAKLTRNRFMGMAMGAVTTGLVNSSSVTTVILIGFISAGVMTLSQSVSVIMGANIGSTFTAQILAFNVSQFALPAFTLGFAISALARTQDQRDYGRMLLGAGLVFYGMAVMSEAMAPLRDYPPFIGFVGALDSAAPAVLTGAVFTAIVQSSAATTGIAIVLAGQGLLSLETGVALALGANIGTCATAGLAVIGKSRDAMRAALAHVLFNVVGVLIWLALIPQLAELARAISPAYEALTGAARLSAEVPRQIANAHTIFNVANTALLIGFTTQIARLVERLVPEGDAPAPSALEPRHLDESVISTPAIALQNARFEIARMGAHVCDMVERALPVALAGSGAALDELAERDGPVDALHRALIAYLGKISAQALNTRQSADLLQLVAVANDLEHIADSVATGIVSSSRKRLKERAAISPEAARRMTLYHDEIVRALREAISAVVEEDEKLAGRVRRMKRTVSDAAAELSRERFHSLPARGRDRVDAYVREVELVEILDGIFKISRRIARSQLGMARS